MLVNTLIASSLRDRIVVSMIRGSVSKNLKEKKFKISIRWNIKKTLEYLLVNEEVFEKFNELK